MLFRSVIFIAGKAIFHDTGSQNPKDWNKPQKPNHQTPDIYRDDYNDYLYNPPDVYSDNDHLYNTPSRFNETSTGDSFYDDPNLDPYLLREEDPDMYRELYGED